MKERMSLLWEKICAGATVAGEFATKTAETVGVRATDAYNASKTNLKILDLTTDIEVLYKEIGRIIYAAHTNEEAEAEKLDELLSAIDEKKGQIEELRALLSEKKDKVCPECEKKNDAASAFCGNCGAKLSD